MYSSFIACAVNMFLNVVFIPICGYLVSGVISLLSYIILCYVNYYYICKIDEFKNPFNKITIFVVPLILSVSVSSVTLLYQWPNILRAIAIILVLVIFINYNKIKSLWTLKKNH